MRKLCLYVLIYISSISCSSYTITSYRAKNFNTLRQNTGTIQAPLLNIYNNYGYTPYNNWQFYYGTNRDYWNNHYFYPSTPVGLIETIIITGMAFLITIPLGIRTIKNLTITDKEQ